MCALARFTEWDFGCLWGTGNATLGSVVVVRGVPAVAARGRILDAVRYLVRVLLAC